MNYIELKPEKYKGVTIRITKGKPDQYGAVLYKYTHGMMTGWSSVPYGGNKETAIAYARDSIDAVLK